MKIEIGHDSFLKEANVLEEIAFRDTWGRRTDSFISMLYERLLLMRDLLAPGGSIFVHCDARVNSFVRLILSEIFSPDNFHNEIIWLRSASGKTVSKNLSRDTDTIYWYSRDDKYSLNPVYKPLSDKTIAMYSHDDHDGRGPYRYYPMQKTDNPGPDTTYDYIDNNGKVWKCPKKGWRMRFEKIKALENDGRLSLEGNTLQEKAYWNERENEGTQANNLWNDIPNLQGSAVEILGYPTQKPEKLIERIMLMVTEPGDLVADFFCGSGTTLAVAEKLGRKWIGADLGKFAIHTTRKRMLDVQRYLKTEGKNYHAFEILNLGKYERQHYIGVNPNLRDEEKKKQLEEKEHNFVNLILHAYRADKASGFKTFHGKKNNRLVAIGPINLPVTRLFVEEVILECKEKHITKVDVLGFEFEMGLFPNIQEEAKNKGIDLALKYIPREVFDKRAVEKNQVVFHDVSYIELKPHLKGNSVAVELTDFSVFYNQDTLANVESTLKNGATKIVVENGKIIKVTKDKAGIVSKELLTKSWTDWIDYWAVDFNFENKKEFVRVWKEKEIKQDGTLQPFDYEREYEEVWTGDYVFENEWQSFRTRKNKEIELKSIFKECKPGRRKIAVKVVDIFGNDTMKIIEVTVGVKN